MKTHLLKALTAVILLVIPTLNFAQAPNLGAASSFALFTAVGAFNNTGASNVTGDVGTNVGAFNAFPPGTLVGQKNVANTISASAATDVALAYSFLFAKTPDDVIGVTLGNGQILGPGVHSTGAASTLEGNLTLDGGGDPNALFIIKIGGAFSTATNSTISLTGSASLCNVYWQVVGAFTLGANSSFTGTVIAGGAIELLEGSSLMGRGLTTAGAITLHNNIVTLGTSASAIVIAAGGATSFCEGGNVILSGNNGGIWSNAATTPTITVTTSGDYFVTNTNACGGSVTSNHILVTVNPLPTAITGSNASICSGSNVTLGASSIAGHTYSWTPTTGLSSSTISNPVASPTATTTYTLTETITATGCQKTNSVTVTVGSSTIASIISAGGATSFCEGGNVILSGNNGGIWSNAATTPNITVTTSGDYFVTNINACGGSATSNHILVTVNPLPIATTGSNASICDSSNIALGASPIAGHTYSWTPTTGLSSATISNPVASPTATITYTLTETITATGCQKTNSVTITVNALPIASIITANGATTFCASGVTKLCLVTLSGNNGGIWSTGATTPSIIVNTSGDYFVTNTNNCGSVTSNHIIVTVNQPPTATTGSNASICNGSNVTLGAPSIIGHTYSWTPATGLSSATISNPVASPNTTTTYTLTETITATGCQKTNSVTITVNPLPTISIISASGPITFCAGDSVILSGYKGGIWSNAATTASIKVKTSGDYFVTNTNACGTVTSNHIIVTVNPLSAASIISASGSTAFCEGGNVILSGNSGGIWNNSATTPAITITTSGDYFVTNTNACGSVTSNHIVVTVNALPTAATGSNASICIGSNVTLGATSIAGHTYLWTPTTGLSSATIANPVASPTATTTYMLTETITATDCQNTNSVTVTVIPDLSITIQPTNQTACVGSSVSFSVTAAGTDPIYQWRKGALNLTNGANISGATSSTLTINSVNFSDTASDYNVVITGTCSSIITSINVSLLVNASPIISISACVGTSVSFSVSATEPGITYQWRKGATNLINGGNISGATSSILTINPVDISDAAPNYNVVLTGTCSPNETSNVSLIVNAAPNIITGPVNQIACVGGSADFSVTATGVGNSYQWRKGTTNLINGGNISGATSDRLTINPIIISDIASNYNVVITGICSPKGTKSSDASLSCVETGTASPDEGNTNVAVTIYPNPFTTSIDIILNDPLQINNVELRIYNLLGAEIMSTTLLKKLTTLETSNLFPGIYIYKVIGNNKTIQSGKLIRQ